jgi:CRISPR-associated protein Csd1
MSKEEMPCLVCGKRTHVLLGLREPFKPVPGGQPSGSWIGAAGGPAFGSYGLDAGRAAPTCWSCAEAFTFAANTLLSTREERITLGGAVFLCWTREDVGFSFFDFFNQPNADEVRLLMRSIRTGGPRPDVDATAFFATVISGNSARAVVRDWIDTTLGEAKQRLVDWFDDQSLIDRNGEGNRPLGLRSLAAASVRDLDKDLAPPTVRALLRAALTATPAPFDLLARAVRRNRADGGVTHPRAALIKLVLARRGMSRQEVRQMAQLVPDHPSPAYHCGRLLAVLDAVQRAALGSVNATIVDRYFGTASSAPGTVFPYLIRGSAPHLAKLRKTRQGAYQSLQQRLEEVMDRLPAFQPVLTLEDQGLFALGYYHQRADDRRRARDAAERRRSAGAAPTTAEADDITDEELAS